MSSALATNSVSHELSISHKISVSYELSVSHELSAGVHKEALTLGF